jgi:RNA polymerase sigma-70 factor (ECF subfamily)
VVVTVSISPDPLDHASLVSRLAEGDPTAEAALAEQFGPRLRAMMMARTRDGELARDLAQDALIALLQALRQGQLRDHERLPAFAHGIARNIVNNFFRTRQREPQSQPLLDEEMAVFSPSEDPEEQERLMLVRKGLADLSPGDREILKLTLADGLKPGEIAEKLGLTAEVVRARKSRAQKRIVAAIEKLSRIPSFAPHREQRP